ncbi:major yolk protein-like [Ptychodera flava]|uniref:major yolk protein-like n=1 Tax=Ptychodera flava TaxID=63121 RepID=UPI00396A91FA
MKVLLLLAVAVVGSFAVQYPPPSDEIPTSETRVRWCVHTVCEEHKCWRMANDLMYNIQPRKAHVCLLATSADHCMDWVKKGHADIVVARGEDIWKAYRVHNMKPIAYELPVYKGKERMQHWESISVAVVPKSSHISQLSELEHVQSCHAGVHHTSSWMSPMCSLIHNDVMPHRGDMVESAAHFFSKSCVPGVLDKDYDINGTIPEHLCEICHGQKEDNSWCHKTRDTYAGFHGAGLCLSEGKGQVAFLDHTHIPDFKEKFGNDYKLVCMRGTAELDDWKIEDCHIGYVPRPTVFTNHHHETNYHNDVWDILRHAVTHYSRDDNMNLFGSDDYICRSNPNPRDLIFRDNTNEFVHIPEDKSYMDKFLDIYDTCHHMTPKPRAKFCVITEEAYTKCIDMKHHFFRTDKVNEVSWGCMWAHSKMECMKALHEGTVDMVSLDPMETFIAGREFHHHPILSQHFDVFHEERNGKRSYNWDTETYTIGVMLRSVYQEKFGRDNEWINLKDLNTCHSGISRTSSFHHPMGWMLSNGTIPRVGSVFESVNRHFGRSCLPGAKHWNMRDDLVLGHEFNWGFHGITFHNFTGMQWFVWNVPYTWNYYNWHRQTPRTFANWMEHPDMLKMMAENWNLKPDNWKWDSKNWNQEKWDSKNWNQEKWDSKDWNSDSKDWNSESKEWDQENWNSENWNSENWNSENWNWNKNIQRWRNTNYHMTLWNHFKQNLRTVPEFMLQQMPNIEYFWMNWKTMVETGEVRDMDYRWMKHPVVMSYLRVYFPAVTERWIDFFDNMDWEPVHEDKHNRYSNPIWLSPKWEEFWNNMKVHREEMCMTCGGHTENHCVEGSEEPYWGTRGSLHCVKEHRGDITFLEAHKFEPYTNDVGMIPQDFVLICPSGKVVHYVDEHSIEDCHFGRVPFPALVTSHKHTGSWRWNITKALLHAQKIYDQPEHNQGRFVMFGEHSVFHPHTTTMYPIHLINQTHHTWLGPMFLRSMEALVKPSNYDWWKMHKDICHAETFPNVIYHRDGRCNAIVEEVTCMGNPTPKTISLGRIGQKYTVTVPMCSRPSRFMRKMVEFTCDTGYGYITPVMMPTECECIPCEDITHAPEWSHDHHWKNDERKYEPNEFESNHMDLWGNRPWWMHRETYDNWFQDDIIFPLNQDWNVNRHMMRNNNEEGDWWNRSSDNNNNGKNVCEPRWCGMHWRAEWFPHMHHDVCSHDSNTWTTTWKLNTQRQQWNNWHDNVENI